jgi:hypothetical protein
MGKIHGASSVCKCMCVFGVCENMRKLSLRGLVTGPLVKFTMCAYMQMCVYAYSYIYACVCVPA